MSENYPNLESYFPLFRLNMEIYGVNLRVRSKFEKIWTRQNSEFFSYSVLLAAVFEHKTTQLLHTLNRMSIGSPDAALNKCILGKSSLASRPIAQTACWFCERSSMYNSLPLGVITFLLKLQNTWPLWYDLYNNSVPAIRLLLLNIGRNRPSALKLVTFTLFSFL